MNRAQEHGIKALFQWPVPSTIFPVISACMCCRTFAMRAERNIAQVKASEFRPPFHYLVSRDAIWTAELLSF